MTPYFRRLRARIRELGGAFNAHLHLDRAGTYEASVGLLGAAAGSDVSHLSLSSKHALIPAIHASPCYDTAILRERVGHFLDLLVDAHTARADTLVDVTADRVGLRALEQLRELKHIRAERLDLRVGAYSPLGYRDSEPERWRLLLEGAAAADFIGSLPERDDRADYFDHIGYAENCRRMVTLSQELNRPLHMHVDQQNLPFESGTETVLRVVRELRVGNPASAEPSIWLVHVVSPSTYEEARFRELLAGLVERNIGIICCPSAALSMRQIRPVRSPTGNSIARVLEMLAAGLHVRIGSDNVCDITSPAGTADLVDELFVLCNAVRFYDVEVLAKLGAGQRLDASDIGRIRTHLEEDRAEVARVVRKYSGADGN